MIPDNVEKIIMTKEDYDRNVEQLLYDKINAEQEVERLHSIISEAKNKTNDIEFRIAGKDFNYYFKLKDMAQGKELLKVLDKAEENK